MGFSLSSDPIKFIIILILGASVIMDSFSCFLRSIFSIAERMEYQAFLMVIEAFIELGLFIFVLFHSMSLTKVILVAVILLISSSLNNVINFHFFLKFYKKIRLEWDFAFWKKKLLAGFPFMLIYILGLINLKVDIIIVSRMLGDRAAGLINSDFKLLEQFFIVPSILSFVLLPVFSRLSVSLVKIQKLLRTFLPLMIIAGILAVVFCHIFGRTAINIVYGAEFSEAFSYFGIASWLLLPFFVKPIFEKLLFGLGREMSLCVLYFFGAVLNAVLAIILTARFGINGVLIATLTCEVLLVIICTYSYKRIYKNSLKYDGDSILVNGSLSQ